MVILLSCAVITVCILDLVPSPFFSDRCHSIPPKEYKNTPLAEMLLKWYNLTWSVGYIFPEYLARKIYVKPFGTPIPGGFLCFQVFIIYNKKALEYISKTLSATAQQSFANINIIAYEKVLSNIYDG